MTEQNYQENNSEMTRKDFELNLVAKAWTDEGFRQQLISNPKTMVEQELGEKLPEDINVEIIQEPLKTLYIVLPTKPETVDELDDKELEAIAGGSVQPLYGVSSWRPWPSYPYPPLPPRRKSKKSKKSKK